VKVNGSAVLHSPADEVWRAIHDPAVLAGVIPGCESLTPLAENKFGLGISLGVASIKGRYTGEVELQDIEPGRTLTMKAAGSGAPGTINTTVAVSLDENPDGTCTLTYDADAAVGGMVGGVGQRVLTGVAKKTAGQFFSAIDGVLTGTRQLKPVAIPAQRTADTDAAPAVESPAGAVAALLPMTAAAAPAAAGSRLELLGAALFGALSMAVGVLIGGRLTRRR
jgi:uncharacterized protein